MSQLIKISFKCGTLPCQEAVIKEIHGLRYVVETESGEIFTIYEDNLIEPLTDKEYWGIIKEAKVKKETENNENILQKESIPATEALPA
jgi:hypothetical protein